MTTYQNAFQTAQDLVSRGKITTDEANVLIVQMMGVRVVHGRLPAVVRKALNNAVERGELGYIKRRGLAPEVYHHINARARALEEQEQIARDAIKSIKKTVA